MEECRKCAVMFEPELGNAGVCDECFENLEIQGYSLEDMLEAYPPFCVNVDDCEECYGDGVITIDGEEQACICSKTKNDEDEDGDEA